MLHKKKKVDRKNRNRKDESREKKFDGFLAVTGVFFLVKILGILFFIFLLIL